MPLFAVLVSSFTRIRSPTETATPSIDNAAFVVPVIVVAPEVFAGRAAAVAYLHESLS